MPTYSGNKDRAKLAPHIETLLSSFVPSHIRESYPELIEFVKAYLSYLEETNLSGYYQNTLQDQRDIRTQDSEFLRRIEKEIGLFVPRDYEADPILFYDKISEIWRSKGTDEGLKLFFRLFLDDPVQIRLPYEQVLIPSDGRWTVEDKIRVSMISGNPEDFEGKRIIQVEQFAEATIAKVERRVYSDGIIWELIFVKASRSGNFIENNTIAIEDDLDTRAEVYRSVTGINIDNGGVGYSRGDFITLQGYEGISFTAYVDAVDESGTIEALQIANYGSGNTPNHIKEKYKPAVGTVTQDTANAILSAAVGLSPEKELFEDQTIEFEGETYPLGDVDRTGNGEVRAQDALEVSRYLDGVQTDSDIINYIENGLIPFVEQNQDLYNSYFNFEEPTSENDVGEYYLEDFLVYEYATDNQVGNSSLTFEIDTVSGSGAEFSINYGAFIKTRGRYVGVKGQLSESIVLQDSFFYQKYSYEVLTNFPINRWQGALKRTIGPAGTIPFANIRVSDVLDLSISTQQFDRFTTPGIYTIEVSDELSENLLSVDQTYVEGTEFYFSEDYTGSYIFNETSSVGTTDSSSVFTTQSI